MFQVHGKLGACLNTMLYSQPTHLSYPSGLLVDQPLVEEETCIFVVAMGIVAKLSVGNEVVIT